MPRLEDLQSAIAEFNQKYPRPGMRAIEHSPLYDIEMHWPMKWHGSDFPGVYVFLSTEMQVVYVGKASCGHRLGSRLGAYFKYGVDRRAFAIDAKSDGVRFVVTIAMPIDRAFEAAAVEEYLIARLLPERNRNGKIYRSSDAEERSPSCPSEPFQN